MVVNVFGTSRPRGNSTGGFFLRWWQIVLDGGASFRYIYPMSDTTTPTRSNTMGTHIAAITINRKRWSRNRKTGERYLRDVTYTGTVYPQTGANNTADMILTGPRGGAVLVTVWPNGRYHWATESELRNGKGERGHVHNSDFEIVEMVMLVDFERPTPSAPRHQNQGTKYDAALDLPEITKAIRKAVKALVKLGFFPGLKVSVQGDRRSTSWAIDLTITGWEGEIANGEWVRRGFDTDGGRIPMYTEQASKALDVIRALANQWNYDNSDRITDYSDNNYFLSVEFTHELREADYDNHRVAA